MKRMLFVMNPYAGLRKANRYLAEIIGLFNGAGYEVLTHMTSGTGDCARVVTEKAAEVDVVVCAGGDGTFNETVTGLMQSGAKTPIGYIPCGSTNDFAMSLKIPLKPLDAAKAIVEGAPKVYDVGKFADRYFSYVASFGIFTKTAYTTPQNVKNALGHTAYLLEGISELSQIRKEHVRFELDDQVIEDDFLFGAISNSTSVGGILSLDPKQVDMSDGRFELLLVRAPRDLIELSECIVALQKQTYNCAMMTFVSAQRLQIFAESRMNWTLDGEREQGHSEITVENLHRAISLIQREV